MLTHLHAILLAINLSFIPTWVTQVLILLGATITGAITKYGWDGIEKVVPLFAKIPSYLKPFATGALATAIGMIGAFLNQPLPTDVHLWTNSTFSLFAGAVFSWLIDHIQKAQAAKAAAAAAVVPAAAAVAPAK